MRRIIGTVLIVAAIALAVASTQGFGRPLAPAVAFILFLAGANLFGPVSRLAGELSPLKGKTVRVKVWGTELGDAGFEVKSIRALGAGLHLYLRPLPNGPVTHLKIAQPRGTVVGATGAEITTAKYIQWAGRKIRKPELPIDSREPLPKAFLIGIDERAE